jgi:probable rRNA maturation factor
LYPFVNTDIVVECNIIEDQDIFCLEKITRLLGAALLKTGKNIPHPLHVTIVLMTNQAIQAYNAQYRNKNVPTNVLAFPTVERHEPWVILPDHPIILGDIFISWEYAMAQAAEQGKSRHHHAMHLVIHGFLHLLHYDHESDSDAKEMEDLERAIFQDAGWPDPYAEREDLLPNTA